MRTGNITHHQGSIALVPVAFVQYVPGQLVIFLCTREIIAYMYGKTYMQNP